jgi:hypothetical protein
MVMKHLNISLVLFFIGSSSITIADEKDIKIFKAGPVHIINKSTYPLEIEVRQVHDFDRAVQKRPFAPEQEITLETVKLIQKREEAKTAVLNNGTAVYELLIYLPQTLGQKEPLKFPIHEALDQIQSCTKHKNTQEITAMISIESKTGIGFYGRYTYYTLKTDFICGKYVKKPIEEEWQLMNELADVIEEVNINDRNVQPFLSQDIIHLHPGWDKQKADEFYDQLIQKSAEEIKAYSKSYKQFTSGHVTDDNIIKKKYDQLVALAKTDNFLKSDAKTDQNWSTSDGTARIKFSDDGYVHFLSPDYLKGPRSSALLDDYIRNYQNPEIAQKLVKTYKIHSMPEDSWESLMSFTDRFIKLLMSDSELQNLVGGFKVRIAPILIGDQENKIIMPYFVVYIFNGKDAAQKVLDKLYNAFKGIKGLGLPPRHNAIVNDLIYVAQGNGQEKGGSYSKYWEQPRQVYYRNDITGSKQDYHLKHPQTGADLS